jgi:hypothetical protein
MREAKAMTRVERAARNRKVHKLGQEIHGG